ncbi:hypothetical protein T10_11385, partial [Trichinella papuae]
MEQKCALFCIIISPQCAYNQIRAPTKNVDQNDEKTPILKKKATSALRSSAVSLSGMTALRLTVCIHRTTGRFHYKCRRQSAILCLKNDFSFSAKRKMNSNDGKMP